MARPYRVSFIFILTLAILQCTLAWIFSSQPFWTLLIASWLVGSVISLALFSLIHEASHNQIFASSWLNYVAGFIANLPLVVPLSVNYRYYHLAHHAYLGQQQRDPDLPLTYEARMVSDIWWRKLLWIVAFAIPYGVLRPLANKTVPKVTAAVTINAIIQILFLYVFISGLGSGVFWYLGLSTLFATSLSPAMGARGLLEHYTLQENQETYSYYGPYNYFIFNAGYHCEHHDLPGIPWIHLPKIKTAAPDLYQTLYKHGPYFSLLLSFVLDKKHSLWRRIIRQQNADALCTHPDVNEHYDRVV